MSSPARNVPYTEADRRYWRTRGNLRVRKRRMARLTLRWTALAAVHLFVLASLAFAASRLVAHAIDAGALALRSVEISGLARMSDSDVERVLRPYLGSSLLGLDVDEVTAALEREPWIRVAHVRRVLPDSLDVRVVERVPVARVERGEGFGLVDVTGVVLPVDEDAADDRAGLPRIDGAGELEGPTLAGLVRAALAGLGRVYASHPDLYGEIVAVGVHADALEIRLRRGERVLLDRDRPDRNLDTWTALRTDIARRVGTTETVDLRWRGRISVIPAAHARVRTTRTGPAAGRSGG